MMDECSEIDWDSLDIDAMEKNAFAEIEARNETSAAVATCSTFDEGHWKSRCYEVFGFEPTAEQLFVLAGVSNGRDVLAIWATGKGKSLCYQLPAFVYGKTSIVISPLISLMQDQSRGLNVKSAGSACFLGSAQMDKSVERDALNGKYRVMYVTPEKAVGEGFCNALVSMRNRGLLCLVAIDEAHCVSEWGTDFRLEYRALGVLKTKLSGVPLIALTATATPRVQNDISSSLGLYNPLKSIGSLFKQNLTLNVIRKSSSKHDDMVKIAKLIKLTVAANGSCIVYVPTQNATSDIAAALSPLLGQVKVGNYHGGMAPQIRSEMHEAFLRDELRVMVATIAFGMGIDKPDVRLLIHWGPPQSLEAYVQHNGRAGRDNGLAGCYCFFNDNDLTAYESDYFTQGLNPAQKAAKLASLTAMRQYSSNLGDCRWTQLFHYFEQPSPPPQPHLHPGGGGAWQGCGDRCDSCISRRLNSSSSGSSGSSSSSQQLKRDFTTFAKFVMGCLQQKGATMTELKKKLEAAPPTVLQSLPKGISKSAREELLSTLLSDTSSFRRITESFTPPGRTTKTTYNKYHLSHVGQQVLSNPSAIVLVAIPEAVRKVEREAEEKKQRLKQELLAAGVDVEAEISAEEAKCGYQGAESMAHLEWSRLITRLTGDAKRSLELAEAQGCFEECKKWQVESAALHRVAPASIVSEYKIKQIALTKAQSALQLHGLGLRGEGVADLASRLANHYTAFAIQRKSIASSASSSSSSSSAASAAAAAAVAAARANLGGGYDNDDDDDDDDADMERAMKVGAYDLEEEEEEELEFDHEIVVTNGWQHEAQGGKPGIWVAYADLWHNGATLDEIAKSPPMLQSQSAKPRAQTQALTKVKNSVLPSTVLGHVLYSLLPRRTFPPLRVDMKRLLDESRAARAGPPSTSVWRVFSDQVATEGLCPVDDPTWIDSAYKVLMNKALAEHDVPADYRDRSELHKTLYSQLSLEAKWFVHLRAVGVVPTNSRLGNGNGNGYGNGNDEGAIKKSTTGTGTGTIIAGNENESGNGNGNAMDKCCSDADPDPKRVRIE